MVAGANADAFAAEDLADIVGMRALDDERDEGAAVGRGRGAVDPDAGNGGETLEGAHPHDIGEILGREGVCVRTGHHCAQPLMRRLGATATTRASYSVFSTRQDTDRLLHGLESVARIMQL